MMAVPAFVDRILAHRPDFAVWLAPAMADVQTMESLADAGVRLTVLTSRPVLTRAPSYIISWRHGIEAALRAWKRKGVGRVTIPVESQVRSALSTVLEATLRELDMPYSRCPLGKEPIPQFLARLAAQPAGVIFDYDIWHAKVCAQAPAAFAHLLSKQRVLNFWSLSIDAEVLGGVRTDAVLLPWPRIVNRMVDDLCSGAIIHTTENPVFAAEWKPHVPAAQIARLFAYEQV